MGLILTSMGMGDSPRADAERTRDLNVIDPALDQENHPHMSLRVHMSSPFVSSAPYPSRLVNISAFDSRRFDRSPPPAPPPIATLAQPDHSPSPSVVSQDRSSNSTPHIRRSPPMGPPPPNVYYHQHDAQLIPSPAPRQSAHFSSRQEPINAHPYTMYAPQQHPFDQQRYDHHPQDRHHYSVPSGLPSHFPVQVSQMHEPYGRQQYPGNGGGPPPVTIVHTDDAATKLTDGIRRRCFNCCTTDTSTWRRSNLSPGKVLCNKCGLFERTHSRPRPDQFPHKRGPLAASTLRGRTPPGLSHPSSHPHSSHQSHNGTQLPPISVGGAGGSHPYQYHHGSLTPLNAGGQHQDYASAPQGQNPLPGLGSWHNTSSSSSGASGPSAGGPGQDTGGGGNGGGGGPSANGSSNTGNNSASNSAHGTPLLQSRRPTIDASPRMQPSSASGGASGPAPSGTSSARVRYDDGLASNAVVAKEEGASPPMARSSVGNGAQAQQLAKAEVGSPERDV